MKLRLLAYGVMLVLGFLVGFGVAPRTQSPARLPELSPPTPPTPQAQSADMSAVLEAQRVEIQALEAQLAAKREEKSRKLFAKWQARQERNQDLRRINPRAWEDWARENAPEALAAEEARLAAENEARRAKLKTDLDFLNLLDASHLPEETRQTHKIFAKMLQEECEIEIALNSLQIDDKELKNLMQARRTIRERLSADDGFMKKERVALIAGVLEEYRAGAQVSPTDAVRVINQVYELTGGTHLSSRRGALFPIMNASEFLYERIVAEEDLEP